MGESLQVISAKVRIAPLAIKCACGSPAHVILFLQHKTPLTYRSITPPLVGWPIRAFYWKWVAKFAFGCCRELWRLVTESWLYSSHQLTTRPYRFVFLTAFPAVAPDVNPSRLLPVRWNASWLYIDQFQALMIFSCSGHPSALCLICTQSTLHTLISQTVLVTASVDWK